MLRFFNETFSDLLYDRKSELRVSFHRPSRAKIVDNGVREIEASLRMSTMISISRCRFFATPVRADSNALIVATVIRVAFMMIAILAALACKEGHAQSSTMDGCDIWEISTRHLSCKACCLSTDPAFDVHRWTNCRWQCETMDAATGRATDGSLVPLTILYVHGNWMERDNARERVRIIHAYLAKRACQPFRLIMLSWPKSARSPHHPGRTR